MWVVGLVGSPRKRMNTDTLVSRALAGAQAEGAEVEKIYLDDLSIRPCRACDRRPLRAGCAFQDDMARIYRALEEADALVIGTPGYYGTVSAQLKLVIDRCNCLGEVLTGPDGRPAFRTRVAKRKPALFIWVADSSRDPACALQVVRLWGKDANFEVVETLVVTDADRDTPAREQGGLLRRASGLGAELVRSLSPG
ncbi:MAG: flavodoxin family protein [Candidatus Bipolaricaulaceae bacterium]